MEEWLRTILARDRDKPLSHQGKASSAALGSGGGGGACGSGG